MRAALHTLMFGGYPLERVAPVARDIGYTGVALMCRPPHLDLDNPGPSGRAGRRVLDDAGPAGSSGWPPAWDAPNPLQAPPRKPNWTACAAPWRRPDVLGAGLQRLWGGADGMSVDDSGDLAAAAAWYGRAAAIAAEAGVRVTIEVHAQGVGFQHRRDLPAGPTPSTIPTWAPPWTTGNLHAAAGSVGAADVAQLGLAHLRRSRQGHARSAGRRRPYPGSGRALLTSTCRWAGATCATGKPCPNWPPGGYAGWIANESECAWPDWETSVAAAKHEYAELNKLIQAAHA